MPAPTQQKRALLAQRIETQQIGEDLADKLQNGIPTLGWEGCKTFVPVHNSLLDAFEIYDTEHGLDKAQLVCSWQLFKGPPPIEELIKGLMERDQARVSIEQQLAAIDKHNDKIVADADKAYDDEMEEASDRMHLAATKDIDGLRGRLY